jgi:hypothetical protein
MSKFFFGKSKKKIGAFAVVKQAAMLSLVSRSSYKRRPNIALNPNGFAAG